MKYIIEIEDVPFGRNDDPVIPHGMDELYRAKGFNSLVFDQFGLDKLTPLDKALEEAYQKGLEAGQHEATTLEYQQGLEEGKKQAKAQAHLDVCHDIERVARANYQKGLEEGKARNENGCVGCRYDDGTTEHSPCNYCCNAYSNQWMAKGKTDKIVVGDEVKDRTDDCGVVTWIYGNDAYVLWQDGSTGNYTADELIKTGRHFNFLASLLSAMKEGAE